MWLVVTECLWRNCIFIFFFTFELLYSLTIESWDGTFLRLKKGSWDPLNLHTQFFEYCNKKKKYHDKAVCLCFGRPDSLGKGQPQGSQETHHRRERACWVWCLLLRYEDLSSEPPHPQKVKCGSHVSKPSTKASPRAHCLCVLNSPCALGSLRSPVAKDEADSGRPWWWPLTSKCTWRGHMHIVTHVTNTQMRACSEELSTLIACMSCFLSFVFF